jgi:hypothetical protein
LLSALHTWFEVEVAKLFAHEPTADAISYALDH